MQQEFTIEDEEFGEKRMVELKEGGATIPVTEENKEEYVRLVVSYRLDNSIKEQVKAFLDGFYGYIRPLHSLVWLVRLLMRLQCHSARAHSDLRARSIRT